MKKIQPIKSIQPFKITQPQKVIQDFRAIIVGDIFHSDTFRGDIYFSDAKLSYISIMSYERPCSPDYFLSENLV